MCLGVEHEHPYRAIIDTAPARTVARASTVVLLQFLKDAKEAPADRLEERRDPEITGYSTLQTQPGTTEMVYDVLPPENLPEPGFYYHFKHNPAGPVNNYAYYIYGVGHHTEEDCRAEDAFMQVYRPLYEEAYAYRHGGLFDLRPLRMFFTPAKRDGKEVPRFTRIADPDVIAELTAIKARMYPDL